MDLLAAALAGMRSCDATDEIRERACRYLTHWLTLPEFAEYRPQLEWLIQNKQWQGLLDRFYQILPFGTGGRRGAVGIGPNRMNLWTLGASVQGHCEYLKERFPGVTPLQVVLAYDVRQFEDKRGLYNRALPNPVLHLSSRSFAQHAASIYIANGIHAHILPEKSQRFLATPELSFAIRALRAHGGLNISASHNPPDDNGGKFYDERGGQPVPPDDQIMADLVEQVTTIRLLPWAETLRSGKLHWLDESTHQGYIELCRKQSLVKPPRGDEIKVVFTPLHGVGSMTAMETLVAQGFRTLPVAEQMAPDGQFPNVTQSPNPEVPASLDKAIALAQVERADLVLATDPDADRIGGAVPDGAAWHILTGNEIAALLTHFKLEQLTLAGSMPRAPIVVRTLVTTGLVSRIARSFGAQVVENLLVGFKYIGDVIWHLEQHGAYEDVQGTPADFVIASEESHGILLTPQMRDKDAGAAALLLAELALDQKRKGSTVVAYLERLAQRFGCFHNAVANLVLPGVEGKQLMGRMLDKLRAAPPQQLGGLNVTSVLDLRREDIWLGPLKGATDAASRNCLSFQLGEAARITLRPSGTEPKAKAYVEACSAPRAPGVSDERWRHTCQGVAAQAKRISEDFLRYAFELVGMKA